MGTLWSRRKDQLSWLRCHNDVFTRLDEVPATLWVDNEKTGVAAGAWVEPNETHRRYALTVRFHINPCPLRSPN